MINAKFRQVQVLPIQKVSSSQQTCLALAYFARHQQNEILSRLGTRELDLIDSELRTLQIDLTIQRIEGSEILIQMADEALKQSKSAHLAAIREAKKVSKTAQLGFWNRFKDLLTGSSRAAIHKAASTARRESAKGTKAGRTFITLYRKDAQVALRAGEIQSKLLLLDQAVSEELRRERNPLYRIKKAIRTLWKADSIEAAGIQNSLRFVTPALDTPIRSK